jgi:hypothetical protein
MGEIVHGFASSSADAREGKHRLQAETTVRENLNFWCGQPLSWGQGYSLNRKVHEQV